MGSAEVLLRGLQAGFYGWRDMYEEEQNVKVYIFDDKYISLML